MASSRATDRAIWGLDRYWHYRVEDRDATCLSPSSWLSGFSKESHASWSSLPLTDLCKIANQSLSMAMLSPYSLFVV